LSNYPAVVAVRMRFNVTSVGNCLDNDFSILIGTLELRVAGSTVL